MKTIKTARSILTGALFLHLLTCVAAAEWLDDLAVLRSSQDQEEVAQLISRISDAEPTWQEVAGALTAMPFPPAERVGEAFIDSIAGRDGVVRTYVVYLPSTYDPARAIPLLVCLHGGVSRTNLPDDSLGYANRNPYLAVAEEQGWAVIFPMGQAGATWWDKVGIENVLAQVRTMKTRYNIDDDRVWMTGFSDGASGSFGFAMLRPTTFAAFVPLNGHMGVANIAGDLPTFPRNLRNSPLYVINTDLDGLYPADKMRTTIEMANEIGAGIHYREYHGIGHDFDYADAELPRIGQFLSRHPRDPFPAAIEWESADGDFGRCHWLQIGAVLSEAPAPWHTRINTTLTDERVSIGFHADDSFEGEGVKVSSLSDGETLARNIGLLAGDVIVQGDGERIRDLDELNAFKRTLSRGDRVQLTVLRDGEERVLDGRLPEVSTYYLFKEERPPAAARASFHANRLVVEGSRLGDLTFWVHPDMVQLDQELVIEVDGTERFRGIVEPDCGVLLENYLQTRDRRLLYVARVHIDLDD